jgi:hypothetical protein
MFAIFTAMDSCTWMILPLFGVVSGVYDRCLWIGLGFLFVGSFLIHDVLSSKSDIPTVYFLVNGHVSIAHCVYRTKKIDT